MMETEGLKGGGRTACAVGGAKAVTGGGWEVRRGL